MSYRVEYILLNKNKFNRAVTLIKLLFRFRGGEVFEFASNVGIREAYF